MTRKKGGAMLGEILYSEHRPNPDKPKPTGTQKKFKNPSGALLTFSVVLCVTFSFAG